MYLCCCVCFPPIRLHDRAKAAAPQVASRGFVQEIDHMLSERGAMPILRWVACACTCCLVGVHMLEVLVDGIFEGKWLWFILEFCISFECLCSRKCMLHIMWQIFTVATFLWNLSFFLFSCFSCCKWYCSIVWSQALLCTTRDDSEDGVRDFAECIWRILW